MTSPRDVPLGRLGTGVSLLRTAIVAELVWQAQIKDYVGIETPAGREAVRMMLGYWGPFLADHARLAAAAWAVWIAVMLALALPSGRRVVIPRGRSGRGPGGRRRTRLGELATIAARHDLATPTRTVALAVGWVMLVMLTSVTLLGDEANVPMPRVAIHALYFEFGGFAGAVLLVAWLAARGLRGGRLIAVSLVAGAACAWASTLLYWDSVVTTTYPFWIVGVGLVGVLMSGNLGERLTTHRAGSKKHLVGWSS